MRGPPGQGGRGGHSGPPLGRKLRLQTTYKAARACKCVSISGLCNSLHVEGDACTPPATVEWPAGCWCRPARQPTLRCTDLLTASEKLLHVVTLPRATVPPLHSTAEAAEWRVTYCALPLIRLHLNYANPRPAEFCRTGKTRGILAAALKGKHLR
jgi:hypothetical protein